MRIITGTARGTKLATLEGLETRPTVERIKEAEFSMIQFEIDGKRVLDLFGGSGQLGLEALSRGAAQATFVDSNRDAVEIIKANAKKTKLFEKCIVLNTDYKAFIRGNAGKNKYDIVFLDPPYDLDIWTDVIDRLERADLIAEGGMIICESNKISPIEAKGFTVRRHVGYSKVYITVLDKDLSKEL